MLRMGARADWIADPVNADKVRRDIGTLPDEIYDSDDSTDSAETYDDLSLPPGCSVDGGDCRFQATQHRAVYAIYACGKNLRRSATGQRWRERAAKGGQTDLWHYHLQEKWWYNRARPPNRRRSSVHTMLGGRATIRYSRPTGGLGGMVSA